MESWYQWIVRLLQLDIFNTLIKIYPMKMIKSSAAGLGRISLIKIKLHEKFILKIFLKCSVGRTWVGEGITISNSK